MGGSEIVISGKRRYLGIVSGFGCMVWDIGRHVSGCGFRVSDFWFRVLKFRVSG